MPEPRYLRVDDKQDPHRSQTFDANCEKTATDPNAVIRKLIDAFNLFVREHGHAPVWPVRLVPIEAPAKKKA